MLVVVIVLAFVAYMGLYLMWDGVGLSLASTEPVLRSLTQAVTMPQNEVFMILRGLLLLSLFYVVGDSLMSSSRRLLRRRAAAAQDLQTTFSERSDHVYRS
jgi:hypothetical protein